MNEMYEMSIISHSYSVIGLLFAIFVNFLLVRQIENVSKYKKIMHFFVFVVPLFLAAVLFTGAIMMAAKHLEFTIENIMMIAIGIIMIILESKRSKFVKYFPKEGSRILLRNKVYSFLLVELLMLISISFWMWR